MNNEPPNWASQAKDAGPTPVSRSNQHFSVILPREISKLGISAIIGELNRTLTKHGGAVVSAAPGAGKSTALPITILQGLNCPGKVLMLEPRRIAARQVAERMASILGEKTGQTAGYRIRFESRIGPDTRIEVLTEGILSRMLISDPTLEGVSVIIFDEFHERSLVCDEALAMVLKVRELIRSDLKVVIMSATIDTGEICARTGFPAVTCEGRAFPVGEIYTGDADGDVAANVTRVIGRALREQEGDILAFLPGEAEIRRCIPDRSALPDNVDLCPLYGMLPFDEQRKALAPSPEGRRKIVLATPIAETSLTIEGVRTVVDSGLCRKMVFDGRSGLSRLETVRISKDMATQRAGRAGRLAQGTCYRLWSPATQMRMSENRIPEILEADLATLVLDLAAFDECRPEDLPWLTPPPKQNLANATKLLKRLGALDENGAITGYGKKMALMPCHPRIAGMLLAAKGAEQKALAADIAAILEDRDPLGDAAGSDISIRIEELRHSRQGGRNERSWMRIIRSAEQYRRILGGTDVCNDQSSPQEIGLLLAHAYPERIARCTGGRGHFILADGSRAATAEQDPMESEEWLAVASFNAREDAEGRIFLAAPVNPAELRFLTRERDNISWDTKKGCIIARHERNIGCLQVSSNPIHDRCRSEIDAEICRAAQKYGTSMLDFSDTTANLQRRVAAAASWHPELDLPDLGTDAVLSHAAQWLPAWIGTATSAAELKKINLAEALWGILSYEQQAAVERIAPSHITVPTGSRIRLEYRQGADLPVLKVRLQECFGMSESPRIDGGSKPVLMELLSPGFKPVQVTSDLKSFWENTYFEVRKELRRRYPKHAWPDNPLDHQAIRGVPKK